jgi:thiol:disulfide interchange protein DsbC
MSIARHLRILGLVVAATVLPSAAQSQQDAPSSSKLRPSGTHTAYPEIEKRVNAAIPDVAIDTIKPAEIKGLYAVTSGHSVIYVDESAKYVINGHIFEASNKRDVTADMLAGLNRVDPASLPLADSFTEKFGDGSRQLYVFSDPDCPYCKKLEHELPKLKDVTVHIFLYPLVQLHPNARNMAVDIWCSKDPGQAWHDKMLDDTIPATLSCDTPIDRNLALARKLGVDATPTLIFPDGKMMAGAMTAERIDQMLGSVH